MQRRMFIKAATATALIAGLPAYGIDQAQAASAGGDEMVTPEIATAEEYGYSTDGDFWNFGFATRQAALAEAAELHGGAYVTAKIFHAQVMMPTRMAETLANSLGTGEAVERIMVNDLTSENESNDYEGAFQAACEDAETASLAGPARQAVAAAFERAGSPTAAAAIRAEEDLPDDIDAALGRIETDETLETELQAMLTAWVDRNDLRAAMMTVYADDVEKHPAPSAARDRREAMATVDPVAGGMEPGADAVHLAPTP